MSSRAKVGTGPNWGYHGIPNSVTRGQTLIAHASYPEVSNGTLKHNSGYDVGNDVVIISWNILKQYYNYIIPINSLCPLIILITQHKSWIKCRIILWQPAQFVIKPRASDSISSHECPQTSRWVSTLDSVCAEESSWTLRWPGCHWQHGQLFQTLKHCPGKPKG